MGRFIHTDKWQEPSAAEVFNQRQNVARLGQQAFQQSQKNTNDTVGNGFFGHMVDAAQANAAGLFAGQLRAVDEGLNWAGEKLGLAEKTGTRDKSGWLEQAAQAMDKVQRRNTAQEELTGLNYLAQQVGSVLGSMAAMTGETAVAAAAIGAAVPALGAAAAGAGTVASAARLAGIASRLNKFANAAKTASLMPKTGKAIDAARKMWGSGYLQNYYKLQMMNSPAEALGQAGNLLKQLEDEGYDRDTIRAAALWSGTLNAAFLHLANMAEGKMAALGAKAIASNPATPEALKTILKPTMLGVGATLGKAARTAAWQGLSEGGEEATQDYIDQFATQAAQGKSFGDMTWDHATAAKSFVDAAVGSAALGLLGGATNYRSRAKNFNANGHNFQLSDDGRTWSVDGNDAVMKPAFNKDGTPVVDKETGEHIQTPQPYTAKEIAALMGNDVTESDVRGAMRTDRAQTTNVSSGDARPTTVTPDTKKEAEQQAVPGFTINEDDNGNVISYVDNISGVEYKTADGWRMPADDKTGGTQLFNINSQHFANANGSEAAAAATQKTQPAAPPVTPQPTPQPTVKTEPGMVYTPEDYEDNNPADSGWQPMPDGSWQNSITGEIRSTPPATPPPAPPQQKVEPNEMQKEKLGVAEGLLNAKKLSRNEYQKVAQYINEHPEDDRNMEVVVREVTGREKFTMPSAEAVAKTAEEVKQKQDVKKVGNGTTYVDENGKLIHVYETNTMNPIAKKLDKLKNELYDPGFITNDEYEKAIEIIYKKHGKNIEWAKMLSAIRGKSFRYPTADEIAKRRAEIENGTEVVNNAETVNTKPEEVKVKVPKNDNQGKPEVGEGSKPKEEKVEPKPERKKKKDKKPEQGVIGKPDDLTPTKVQQEMLDELDEDDTEVFGESDGEVELGALRKELPREKPKATAKKEEPKPVEQKKEEPKAVSRPAETKANTVVNTETDRVYERLPALPKDVEINWKGIQEFIDDGYQFKRVQVADYNGDMYVKLSGTYRGAKEKQGFLHIPNWQQYTANELILKLEEQGALSRHLEDALLRLYKNNGVRLGSIISTLTTYKPSPQKQESKPEVKPEPVTNNNSYNQYLETKTEAQRKKAQDFLEKEVTVAEDVQTQLGNNQIKNKRELVEAIAAAQLPLKKIGNRYKYQTPDGKAHLASKTEFDYYNYLIGQNEQTLKEKVEPKLEQTTRVTMGSRAKEKLAALKEKDMHAFNDVITRSGGNLLEYYSEHWEDDTASSKRIKAALEELAAHPVLNKLATPETLRHYLKHEFLDTPETLLFQLYIDADTDVYQWKLDNWLKKHGLYNNSYVKWAARMLNGLSANHPEWINYNPNLDLRTINLRPNMIPGFVSTEEVATRQEQETEAVEQQPTADETEKKKLAEEIVVKYRQFVAKAKGLCDNFRYTWEKYMGIEMDGLARTAEYLDEDTKAVYETARQQISDAVNDFVNAANVYDKGGPNVDTLVKLSKEELEKKNKEAEDFYAEKLSCFQTDIKEKLSNKVMPAVEMLRSIRTDDVNDLKVIQKRCDNIEYNMFKKFGAPKPNPITTQESTAEETTEEKPTAKDVKDEYGMSVYDYDNFVNKQIVEPADELVNQLSVDKAELYKTKLNKLLNKLDHNMNLLYNGMPLKTFVKVLVSKVGIGDKKVNYDQSFSAETARSVWRGVVDNVTKETIASSYVTEDYQDKLQTEGDGTEKYMLQYFDYLVETYKQGAQTTDAKKERRTKDAEEQAQEITDAREQLLRSFIEGSFKTLKEIVKLEKDITVNEETIQKLTYELNKTKYNDIVKKRKEKGFAKLFGSDKSFGFLEVLKDVAPEVLDDTVIKTEKIQKTFKEKNKDGKLVEVMREVEQKTTLRDFYSGNSNEVKMRLLFEGNEQDIEALRQKAEKDIAEAKAAFEEGKKTEEEFLQEKAKIESELPRKIEAAKVQQAKDKRDYGISSKLAKLMTSRIKAITGGFGSKEQHYRDDNTHTLRLNNFEEEALGAIAEAAARYDVSGHKSGATFETFARNKIDNALRNYLTREKDLAVSVRDAFNASRLKDARDILLTNDVQRPSREEIADVMNLQNGVETNFTVEALRQKAEKDIARAEKKSESAEEFAQQKKAIEDNLAEDIKATEQLFAFIREDIRATKKQETEEDTETTTPKTPNKPITLEDVKAWEGIAVGREGRNNSDYLQEYNDDDFTDGSGHAQVFAGNTAFELSTAGNDIYEGDKEKINEPEDITDRASIVKLTEQDTEVRNRILTPKNEKKIVSQLQQLFRGYGFKNVAPHVYEVTLPNNNKLHIDMTSTSVQLIDKLGNKIGSLMDIAGLQGNIAVAGLYSADKGINLIRLTDAVRDGTVPHEVAHFVFNAVFNETERRKILDYYKSKIVDKTGLTEKQLNRRAEEMFCDDFAEYFLNNKSEPKSKLQRMFEKMKRFLRKLVDMFSFNDHPYTEEELDLRRDDVNVNEESLAALFGRIANGDVYNRTFNDGKPANDGTRTQLVSEQQANNIPATAKAVQKAKEMYAKGASDTEVWKKTGCVRYNDGTIKLYVPFSDKDIRGTGLPKDFDVQSLPIQQTDAITDGTIDARVATVKLTDILTPNNKFFKLVPSLQNVQVKYVFPVTHSDAEKFTCAGLYDPQTNTIWLRGDMIKAKSVLAHELQHAIQIGSDGADRDVILSELYPYDIDPAEQEAHYAELTFREESIADDLHKPRLTYETFSEVLRGIAGVMPGNKIFRRNPEMISEVIDSLLSMLNSYKDDNPHPVKDVAALENQLHTIYNDAIESNDISESDLEGFAAIYNNLRTLSEDFRIRQADILKKTGRLSLPDRNMIGEDTLDMSSTPDYQATQVVRDANGVAIEFVDVPTLDGKPTTDEIGGAIVNANNKLLKKLKKDDDIEVRNPLETGDENNNFGLLDLLRSPFRLSKKFPKVFRFFQKIFSDAYEVQNRLRYEWHNKLKDAVELLGNAVEDFNLFNDLMLYGDSHGDNGLDFTADQLNGMVYYIDTKGEKVAKGGKVFIPSDDQYIPADKELYQLPENVAKAYLKVRELSETIYAAVDKARRSGLIKTEKANLKRILEIADPKNKEEGYVEIKGSDGQYHSLDEFRQYLNDKDTYDVRYAKIRVVDKNAVEVNADEDRVRALMNDDTIKVLHHYKTPGTNGQQYTVEYIKYMPHMGHRRGHVPHIFERWMVAYTEPDGTYTVKNGKQEPNMRYVIQDSKKTVNEARESVNQLRDDDASKGIERHYVIFPKAFDFNSFNGADEVTGGGALATQKQKQEMFAHLVKNYEMTPEEANQAVNTATRTSIKNRIYGQAAQRKNVAGFSKDVIDALIREVTSASRYCAMQPAKHGAMDKYEQLFGMSYDADVKISDNPLQAMVKSYIDDCNGKPSKAEQWLNRSLNNWKWYRDNISATYGDRAILQATSVANQITSMAKLGFWNISSAVVNLFQNMNTIALCGFGHFGEGVKAYRDLKFKNKEQLSDKELEEYLLNEQIIEQTGVKYDIGMDSALGYQQRLSRIRNESDVSKPQNLFRIIYENYLRIGDKGLALFSAAESANRQICVLTAYRDGRARGMSHEDAIEYAKEVNKKANFDYGVADTPAFMRAMSGTGVGEMMLLFQKYPVKELELMCEMCKKALSNTDDDRNQAARFWGMYFLMSGIGGIPFLDGFDEWLEHLFGYKPSKRAKLELINEFGDNAFTRSVCYGVGAAAGIDISQRVGMGDMKFGNDQLMFPFNFGGAAGSTLKQMIEAGMEGDPVHIAKAFSPSFGAILEAGQGYSTDKKGRLRTLYSVLQMVVRGTGFRPIEDSVHNDLNTALIEQRSDDRSEKSAFKYRMALKQTQGQPLTADDQEKLRRMGITGKQLADARRQIKQSFSTRVKEKMSKEQRQKYGAVYEELEAEDDAI